jgi:hypothetical protein
MAYTLPYPCGCDLSPCSPCYKITLDATYSFNFTHYSIDGLAYIVSFTTLLNGTSFSNEYSSELIKSCATSGYTYAELPESTLSCDGNERDIITHYYDLCGEEDTCITSSYNEISHLQKVRGAAYITLIPTLLSTGNYSFDILTAQFESGIISSSVSTWSLTPNSRNTGTLLFTQDYGPPQSITLYNQTYAYYPDEGSASFSGSMHVASNKCKSL